MGVPEGEGRTGVAQDVLDARDGLNEVREDAEGEAERVEPVFALSAGDDESDEGRDGGRAVGERAGPGWVGVGELDEQTEGAEKGRGARWAKEGGEEDEVGEGRHERVQVGFEDRVRSRQRDER